MSLFAELKRRNVIRVCIAYLAAMWLIAQVLQLVFDSFETPPWYMQTVLTLMAVGLPFALLFAWAFELTPEGIKREREVERAQSITAKTGKKLDRAIIVVLTLALAYFVVDKFVISQSRLDDAPMLASSSIAVMPFVNLSSDSEQQYFSDGLSEELLNLLAKIPELRVTSRSSSFALRDDDLDIPSIAQKLNVAHVLEGSVRKSGKQIRVTAQLIDARQDRHLWSQTYERTLNDIFAIQDDIAASVVAELHLTLLGTAPKTTAVDPEAYSLYLQARHLAYRNSADDWEKSNALYSQALEIEPDFVAALSGLAANYKSLAGRMPEFSTEEGFARAKALAERALAIDPDHAEAYAELGSIALSARDLAGAAILYDKAISLAPTSESILLNAATLVSELGRNDESLEILEFLVARDPLNPRTHWRLGYAYEVVGRWHDARESFKKALLLSPNMGVTKMAIGLTLLMQEEPDPEAALEWIEQDLNSGWRLVGLALVNHDLGRTEASDAAIMELIDKYASEASYNIAAAFAYRGEADPAFEWLAKAVEYNDPGLSEIRRQAFFFENIQGDARWRPFLERIGMSPGQHAAIEFTLTIPKAAGR